MDERLRVSVESRVLCSTGRGLPRPRSGSTTASTSSAPPWSRTLAAASACVNCKPTKTGVSFTWEKGAWEYDQMSGTGRVTLDNDGRLTGTFCIKDGDSSSFIALRAEEPDEPIPSPPSWRDERRRRR